MRIYFDVDDIVRTRVVPVDGGAARRLIGRPLEDVLGELHPGIRWRSPVLTVDCVEHGDFHLAGSGLTVMPHRGIERCRVILTVGMQPRLQYPASSVAALSETAPTEALVAVLGRTRAALLRALVADRTTSELARCLGTSLSNASQGARALREAGLVTTHRTGRSVTHRLTGRGREILAPTRGTLPDELPEVTLQP